MAEPNRVLTVGAAQLGPIALSETRAQVVERLLCMMARAHERRCDLVVFPELALTSFFPRWHFDKAEHRQPDQYGLMTETAGSSGRRDQE